MGNFNMTGNTTVFIGNVAPGTSYTAGSCTEATVAIIDEYGSAITGALSSTSNRVRVINKKNGTMKYSPFFSYANIITKSKKAYSAATEQLTYLGYNGTSGSLDGSASPSVSSSKTYCLEVELTNFAQYSKSPFIFTVPYYTTSTSQTDLFSGLQKGLIEKLKKMVPQPIVPEIVCSGADAGNITPTIAINNGSRYGILSTTSGAPSVGDVLRAGATGAAKTTAVYVVASVSSTTIEFTNEYQGTTAATLQMCTVTTPGNYGLKLTGQAVSTIKKDDQWQPVTFRAYINNKTDYVGIGATITNSATASKGSGNWKEVIQLERQHSYAHGQSYVSALPQETPNTIASSSYTYDVIYIKASDTTQIDKGRTGTAKDPTFDIFICTDSSILYNDTNGYSLATIFGL